MADLYDVEVAYRAQDSIRVTGSVKIHGVPYGVLCRVTPSRPGHYCVVNVRRLPPASPSTLRRGPTQESIGHACRELVDAWLQGPEARRALEAFEERHPHVLQS